MTRRDDLPAQPAELVSHLEHSMARFLAATRALMAQARSVGDDETVARLRTVVWDAVRRYDKHEYTSIAGLVLFAAPLRKVRVTRADFKALMRWGRWTATHLETLKQAKSARK